MNTVRGQYGEGIGRRKEGNGVSTRTECESQFDRGNIRGDQAADRELALGGGALLFALRETFATTDDQYRLSVQDAAIVALCDQ